LAARFSAGRLGYNIAHRQCGHILIMALTDKYRGSNSNAFGSGADRGMGWAMDPSPGHGPSTMVNANFIFSINIGCSADAGSLIPIAC
jgi:hypothetical protein